MTNAEGIEPHPAEFGGVFLFIYSPGLNFNIVSPVGSTKINEAYFIEKLKIGKTKLNVFRNKKRSRSRQDLFKN